MCGKWEDGSKSFCDMIKDLKIELYHLSGSVGLYRQTEEVQKNVRLSIRELVYALDSIDTDMAKPDFEEA